MCSCWRARWKLCMQTVVLWNSQNSAVVVLQLDSPFHHVIEIFIPSSDCKCQWWYTVLRNRERSASMFQHRRACGCINTCVRSSWGTCVCPHTSALQSLGITPFHMTWMHHMQIDIHGKASTGNLIFAAAQRSCLVLTLSELRPPAAPHPPPHLSVFLSHSHTHT